MKNLTRSETAQILLSHDNYAIVTHRRPDGDTLGSSAVLCMGLRQLGKTAYILENPEITPKYAHLHAGLCKPSAEEGDFVVAVDVASSNMLPDCFKHLTFDLRIDHHGNATSFTPVELVEPGAAACGEIVYGLLTEMGAELDIPMANALYTAISTDTGCFRYANTSDRSFALASACAAVSPDIFRISQALFDTTTLGRLRLQGWVVENMHMLCDGKIVVCGVPANIMELLDLKEEDMGNLSGFLRSIEGVKIAATVRQDEEGHTGISVRAVPGYDAAAICEKFGGGGHKGAAGAGMENVTLEEAVSKLIAAMPEI